MADFENLLLEASGRTGGSNGSRHFAPPSRRRPENAYSDDGSDSKVKDRDENGGYGGRKSNWHKLPLKKRGKDRGDDQGTWGEEEDAEGSGRGSGDGDGSYVGSDLYKDEDDRQQLAQLTELESELVLASFCGVRTYVRSADQAAPKADSESGSQSEDGRSKRCQRMDDEMFKPESNIPTYEDVKDITIRRSKLAKWFLEPFFEDLIVGCFVRVGIGMMSGQRIYRLCVVRNVDASDPDKPYKLENKMTYKYLNCVWGSERSAARWQMARISDSPPLEEEYNQWKKEVERTSGRMPTKDEVEEKKEEIKKTNSFVYSAETVKHMLQEKKSAATRPWNIAAEKERLRREMEAAQYRSDASQVEKIKARLEELAAVRQAQERKSSKGHRLAEMNKKNRVENFKNASELKPENTNLKSAEAGSDPFSRRWTSPKNYCGAGSENKENDDASEIAERNKGVKAGVVATADALEAALDAGKLVDTSAPVDQGTDLTMLHNFDLPISLNTLQKFGGSQGVLTGAMARRQKIEATIGLQVPEDDGRRHATTISISEYKRRRGML